MKDFPLFTTENGVASLILREIPYRNEAYIQIRDSLSPELLLEECIHFCEICGAERIYAAGHPCLEHYSFHTSIWVYKGTIADPMQDAAMLWPVTAETAEEWRSILNRKMRFVPNASTLTAADAQAAAAAGGAYFIHEQGSLLGIGWLEDTHIRAVAALAPGAGKRVCAALQSTLPDVTLDLEVASANTKAVNLYESLGFVKTAEINSWYRVK